MEFKDDWDDSVVTDVTSDACTCGRLYNVLNICAVCKVEKIILKVMKEREQSRERITVPPPKGEF